MRAEPQRSHPVARVTGTVRIVGAGLLGASVGLGLSQRGVDVAIADASPTAARLAIEYGAGRAPAAADDPSIIVVCVPPDVTADVIAAELARYPQAVVTDVASVKVAPRAALAERGVSLDRYIGSHPLAGRERGGAIAARADLFQGRPWVICRDDDTAAADLRQVESLVLDLGGIPVDMTPEDHDRSVAMVSHVPQVVASLLAARFTDADEHELSLAGQGVQDTTRIARSAPDLWVQILTANAHPVRDILRAFAADLDTVAAALDNPEARGAKRIIADAVRQGNAGVERLPGKHGVRRAYEQVVVLIDDTAGQLARLFADLGDLGVNVEDFRMEHSPGAPVGLAEISVLPQVFDETVAGLDARGWRIAGTSD